MDEIHKVATGRRVRGGRGRTPASRSIIPIWPARWRLSRNFVDARTDVAEMHGTAVAGIIAARADNGQGVSRALRPSRG